MTEKTGRYTRWYVSDKGKKGRCTTIIKARDKNEAKRLGRVILDMEGVFVREARPSDTATKEWTNRNI